MINLLPQEYQSLQNSKYRFRLLAAICAFIFVLSLISLVFFLPAHIWTKLHADSVALEGQRDQGADSQEINEEDVSKALADLAEASLLSAEFGSRLPISNVYDTLHALELKSPGVTIGEILYTNRLGQDITLTLRGRAKKREDLKLFAEFLSARP